MQKVTRVTFQNLVGTQHKHTIIETSINSFALGSFVKPLYFRI